MADKYRDNDYAGFLENAWDIDDLEGLLDAVTGAGLAGTPAEGCIPTGNVNCQYEIVQSGSALMVYDKPNKQKVFISGNGLEYFVEELQKEITRREDPGR